MFAGNRFVPVSLVFLLLVLVGCGGNAPKFAPNPAGSFSNASLSGTYAFAATGTNTAGFFSIAGSLQADGNGNIVSGVEDINSGTGVFNNVAITGTYTVRADGRATAALNSSVGLINLDFVLVSGQRGLIIRFDSNATASGSLDLQNPAAFNAAALQGAYALSLGGIDANGNPLAMAGSLSTDGAGTVSSGVADVSDSGSVFSNVALSGTYTVTGVNGRGTLALTSSAGLGGGSFVFYVVDSNHLKVFETDSVPVLAGDAFRQQGTYSNASLSGPYAFTVGGVSSVAPFVAGGVWTADGNGTITTGAEDVSNGSISQNIGVSGTYSIAGNGRGQLSLSSTAGTFNFAIYPSSGGLQMLQIDSNILSSGTAYAQQSSFSNSSIQGAYGLNFSGLNINTGEIDSIEQFTGDGGGHLTGSADFNQTGTLSLSLALTGTYSVASNGRGTGTLKSSAQTTNIALYVVNGTQILFIGLDAAQPSTGIFMHQ